MSMHNNKCQKFAGLLIGGSGSFDAEMAKGHEILDSHIFIFPGTLNIYLPCWLTSWSSEIISDVGNSSYENKVDSVTKIFSVLLLLFSLALCPSVQLLPIWPVRLLRTFQTRPPDAPRPSTYPSHLMLLMCSSFTNHSSLLFIILISTLAYTPGQIHSSLVRLSMLLHLLYLQEIPIIPLSNKDTSQDFICYNV